ncbi:MAG: response regulator transcription factor [Dehalococcoidales bacterium]|nr:response regulator transcription factor [Dehalococcoidales bacterium]
MSPIRIMLADDHALVRQGTRRILEEHRDLIVVGEAENGEEALELVKRLNPDVAILDIRMPGLSGVGVVSGIKQSSLQTKILILSAFDDDEYILALMEAGVSGYLLKTAQGNELVEAVRGIAKGKNILHPDIAMKVARLWAHRRTISGQEVSGQLSPREMEALQLAAKCLSAKAIAVNLNISVRTVNGHFYSIFNKLGVSSRIEAVLYALSRHLVAPEGVE